MTMKETDFNYIVERIKQAKKGGETDTRLGRVLAKWKDIDIPVGRNGTWLLEAFIITFKRDREILAAIDPTVSPDLPPHLLDAVQIVRLFSLRLEDIHWLRSSVSEPGGGEAQAPEEFGEPPQEVGTARAAEILGVSKDTVLKLKAAGLLEYRNTAPPGSSRPVYAFTLRSVMELRTSYERDEPPPRRCTEPLRRRMKGRRKYKHLDPKD